MIPAPQQTQPDGPQRTGLLANLALVVVSLGIALLCCELVARIFLSAPLAWRYPQVPYRADPDLVFALAPNQHAFSADKAVDINARGLRGPVVPYERTAGRPRLLFLGDSIGFGYGVRDGEVVTERVAALLQAQGVPVEVVNTSVPAYNTEQEVTYLAREGVRYRPDWVVVAVCWNDISDKSADRVSPEGWLLRAGGGPPGLLDRLSESPRGYALRNFIKRSRLLYAVTEAWRSLDARRDPSEHLLFRTEVLEGKTTERIEDGWRRVGGAVHRLRELSDRFGFRPVLVAFPIPVALERPFPQSLYPARLQAIAAAEGMPVLDLEPAFRSAYHGHESLFIPYDGDHPNARGHDLAAREIVRFLATAGGV